MKIHVFESLPNQVVALQISNSFKKRFQRRCFLVNIAKSLKKLILRKICERQPLNNVKRNYSSMNIVKKVLALSRRRLLSYRNQSNDLQSKSMDWCLYDNGLRHKRVKCFSIFAGKHLYRSVFFNKYSCRMQLKRIFIQKEVSALVFSWQLSEIFNNLFKERKKALLWEKKYCYKKRGSEIYPKSNYATFFVTSPRFLYFSKELAQFIVTIDYI